MSAYKRVIFIDDQTGQLAETSVREPDGQTSTLMRKPDGQTPTSVLLSRISMKVATAGGGWGGYFAVWLHNAWEVYKQEGLTAGDPIRRFPNEEAAGMFLLHRAARNG